MQKVKKEEKYKDLINKINYLLAFVEFSLARVLVGQRRDSDKLFGFNFLRQFRAIQSKVLYVKNA